VRRPDRGVVAWRQLPTQRIDGILTRTLAAFLLTDDGATILFARHGYGRAESRSV
jgi:hypothetical protein